MKALLWVGIALLLVIGLPFVAVGLLGIGDPGGQAVLCAGLALVVGAVGGMAREVAERRHDARPPEPRLDTLPDGEPALFLPRSTGRTLASTWTLTGLAAVCALGALFTALAGRWGWLVVLALLAMLLLLVAAPHRGGSLAGGLWFTPQRIFHRHDGVSWEMPWEDVRGSSPHEPMPVVPVTGREVRVHRGPAAGRHRGAAVVDGVPVVETRYLAGGGVLASYVVNQAVGNPDFRAALGTPASVPPQR